MKKLMFMLLILGSIQGYMPKGQRRVRNSWLIKRYLRN